MMIIPNYGRKGREVLKISMGYSLGVIIILILCWVRNLESFLFLMGIYAAATAFQSTLLNTMASLVVPEGLRSVIVSYGECMVALGGIIGPALAGTLIPLNENYPFYVYCILLSIGIIQFWSNSKEKK